MALEGGGVGPARHGDAGARLHQFYAVAFEENLSLRQLSPIFPNSRVTAHELYIPIEPTGGLYVYPFGAVVTLDVAPERREAEMARLRDFLPKLTTQIVREDYAVVENSAFPIGITDGMLRVDRFTPGR